MRRDLKRMRLTVLRDRLIGVAARAARWAGTALAVVAVVAATQAGAADPAQREAVAQATEPMSRDAAREALAKMSDAEVRKMMLEHLDRAAASSAVAKPKPATGESTGDGMTGMMAMV